MRSLPKLLATALSANTNGLHVLVSLWPLWVLLALIFLSRATRFIWRARRLRRSGIREIDQMDGSTFEQRLAILFRGLGYRAERVGATRGDFGGDLIVSKDGKRTIVQAKRWNKNVGLKAVQEAVAARGFYKTDAAMVVTNRGFTVQAHKLAEENGVTLWGREALVSALLNSAPKSSKVADTEALTPGRSLRSATASEEAPAPGQMFCARCGKPVSARVRDYCLAHRDRFGGLVYCYDDQRSV